jgi:hypothetical protein
MLYNKLFILTFVLFALSSDHVVYTNALTVSSAQVANGAPTKLVITLSAAVDDAGSTLVATEFQVNIAGGGFVAPSAATVVGGNIELTISSVTHGQSVTYTFTDTNSNIVDAGANELATFTSKTATNNVKPVLSSATVASNTADQVVLTFDGTVNNQGSTGNYAVSGGFTVQSISKNGATVTLQLDKPVQNGNSPTVSYTAGALSMSTGLTVASFTNSAITNNVAWAVSTTVSPTTIGRNKGTAITFQGSGWANSNSKIKLVKNNNCANLATGGTGQVVTGAGTGGGVALTFTINEVIGTTVTVCFAYDGTNYFHIASTTMTVHPVFTGASVSNARANQVVLTFTDSIGITAAASAYSLSNSLTVSSVVVTSGNVVLTTAETIKNTDSGITVSYTAPGSGQKTSSSGGTVLTVLNFATKAVSNNVAWTFSTTVSPTTVGKAVATSISFTGTNWQSGTSKIALVTGGNCGSVATGGTGQAVTGATSSTLTFSINENANTATTACFAYDGSWYVNIPSTTVTTAVPSVSNFGGRTRMAKGESVTFSITGVGLNSGMEIKYVASGSDCANGASILTKSLSSINNVAQSASVTSVTFTSAASGMKLCLKVPTANGGNGAFADASVTMDVPEITGADVTQIGKAVSTKITFTKQFTSTDDKVVLVASTSNCAAAALAGSANEQVLSSTNFVTVTITATQTNALVCLKVQGGGTTGAAFTSTGVQITIAHPSITAVSFSRTSKGETRTLTITGTGLNTGISLQINAGSSCNSNAIITDQALASPNDATTSASIAITLNTAYDNARICFKVPTAQGGTNAYAYNANGVGSFTMDIISLTATNTPQVGLNVQFTTTFTTGGGFTHSSDLIKIVDANTACTGTAIGGGTEFTMGSNSKKQLTLTAPGANAKICIKVDLPGGESPVAAYVDSGVTITVSAPTVTGITSSDTLSYTGLTADVAADAGNSFILYLTGTGLSSDTKIAFASDSGCTTFLSGGTEQALVSGHSSSSDETTKLAKVTFSSVTQANPDAYICIKVLTTNGGTNPAAHTKMQDADNSNADFKIDIRGSGRAIRGPRTASGLRANDGLATNGGFQVAIRESYYSSTVTNDESHGITSIVATFPSECSIRPCFDAANSADNQVHCSDAGAVSHANVFTGTTTLTVATDNTVNNKIKSGIATFQDLKFNHWGINCRVTFTLNSQGGSQVGRISSYSSGNYATRTSSYFHIQGTAEKVVWTNANLFKSGSFPNGGGITDDYVCIAGYECSTQPELKLYDGTGSTAQQITNNYHHGIYYITIYIKSNQDTSCSKTATASTSNGGIIRNNRRWKFVNGVMTFPKQNSHATNPSYDSTSTCYQYATGSSTCNTAGEQSSTGIWFNKYAKDIGVRVEASSYPYNSNYNSNYWYLTTTNTGAVGSNDGGRYFDHTMSVKGKATNLELTFDTTNWVQGYSATQSQSSTGAVTTSNKQPSRNAPFVTVYEKDIPDAGDKTRLTDNCISGVPEVKASISQQHNAVSGTHPAGTSVNNDETPSSGHAIFDNHYIDEFGKNYKLTFTATIPVHFEKITAANGNVIESSAFNVGLLTYKKTIKVKEIDVNTGDYK